MTYKSKKKYAARIRNVLIHAGGRYLVRQTID